MSKEFEQNVEAEFKRIHKFEENTAAEFKRIHKFEENVLAEFKEIHKFQEKALAKFEQIDKFQEKALAKFEQMDKFQEKALAKFEQIDKRLDSMDRSLTLIEDQVMNKIPALFEGYSSHEEKLEQGKEKFKSINNKIENHDIRISYLEEKIG